MKVFLSASIPLPDRDPSYVGTADVVAIREAIKGLILVILERKGHLVFGGHPAITPLIRILFNEAKRSPRRHVTLYQSSYFQRVFPRDNAAFENVIEVKAVGRRRDRSLLAMRHQMLAEVGYSCGVFIGGMEGVIDEFDMFRQLQPTVPVFPIASTGAAAANLHQRYCADRVDLRDELTYPTLFRNLLPDA